MSSTLADDILAISALAFLVCTYTIYAALRIKNQALASTLEKLIDIFVLLALTGMVASGFIMIYPIG